MEFAGKIGVEGFLHCSEMEKLSELSANKECLEVGSFKGLSAYAIAIGCKHLWCVDTFKANSAGQVQHEEFTTLDDFKAAISRFNNVNYLMMTSLQASCTLKDEFDFVFLDAMHTYEDVKEDIQRWWPRVRSGGIMAFHDYGHWDFPGVKKAVDEYFGKELENTLITLGWVVK